MKRLVLVGSVIADLMMTVPALPERGGDVLAGPARLQAGGGFNVLAAASRLGLSCALAGRVGGGALGDLVAAALRAEGVELLLPRLAAAEGDTGLCVGFIEPDAERTFVTSAGVESALDASALGGVVVGADDAVYVSGYDLCYPVTGPAVVGWLDGMTARPSMVFLDPGPLVAQIPAAVLDGMLRHTSVVSVNARELELLGGDVAGLLARCRDDAVLLARDGARGCTVWTRGEGGPGSVLVAAPSVAAVDSTGAGDAHAGAFLAALAAHWSGQRDVAVLDAVGIANAAAAYAVTVVGSATAPTRAQLDRFLAGGGESVRAGGADSEPAKRAEDSEAPPMRGFVTGGGCGI